jgi:20S proteasome alpha/beta subunit
MTMILCMVCSDGVVVVSDSKRTMPSEKPTYNNQKIFNFGDILMAVSGLNTYIEMVSDAIAGSAQYFVETNPGVTAKEVAVKVREQATKLLLGDGAKFVFVVADTKTIYTVEVPDGTITNKEGIMISPKNPKTLPPIKESTTEAYSKYFKKTIELNKGLTVGGRTQVVILKSR